MNDTFDKLLKNNIYTIENSRSTSSQNTLKITLILVEIADLHAQNMSQCDVM